MSSKSHCFRWLNVGLLIAILTQFCVPIIVSAAPLAEIPVAPVVNLADLMTQGVYLPVRLITTSRPVSPLTTVPVLAQPQTPPPTVANVTVLIEPETFPADGRTTVQVWVFATTEAGEPVPDGTAVSLTTTAGILRTNTRRTREGVARFSLRAPDQPGIGQVTAVVDGISATANFTAPRNALFRV